MKKELKGTIDYTLSFGDGHADIQFQSTLDNDLAILAAASYIMQNHYDATLIKRKGAKFLHKKLLADELELLKRGKNGIRLTLDRYLSLYADYQESLKETTPPVEEKIEGYEKAVLDETPIVIKDNVDTLDPYAHLREENNSNL